MNVLKSIFLLKCPRCSKGNLFLKKTNLLTWTKAVDMPEYCSSCHLKYELENGFWWGTGFISYGIVAILSGIFCALWFFTIGFGTDDNRVWWWLGINTGIIILLQPWLMRLGRSLYIHCFVSQLK